MRPVRGGGRVPSLVLRVGKITEAPRLLCQMPADFRLAFGSRVSRNDAAAAYEAIAGGWGRLSRFSYRQPCADLCFPLSGLGFQRFRVSAFLHPSHRPVVPCPVVRGPWSHFHFPLSTFPAPVHHCVVSRHGHHQCTVTSRPATVPSGAPASAAPPAIHLAECNELTRTRT